MGKDYTTVRVEKAAKRVADDAKADDETWSDYLRRCADAEPSVQRLVDADALADELRGAGDVPDSMLAPNEAAAEDMERLKQALETIEERTGRIERDVDDLGGGRR